MELISENIENHILSELNKAEKSIDIAVAWITSERLLNKIEEKRQAGIRIRILCWKDEIGQVNNQKLKEKFKNKLKKNFFEIYEIEKMHDKFCIIDKKIILEGSYNWTEAAKGNIENIKISDNQDFIEGFQKEFDKLRDEIIKYHDDNKFKNTILSKSEELVLKTFDEKIDNYINELAQKNKKYQREHIEFLAHFNDKMNGYINEIVDKNKSILVDVDDRISRQNEQINAFEKRTQFLKKTVRISVVILVISVIYTIILTNFSMKWYKESILTRQEVRENLLKEFEEQNIKLYKVEDYELLESEKKVLEEWISKNPKDSRKFIEYKRKYNQTKSK